MASNGNSTSAVLNLNAGTLTLGGPIFRSAGSALTAVNANGATLRAGLADIVLANDSLGQVNVYKGGLTIDTAGNNAIVTAGLASAGDSGFYPAGGGFAVTNGGAGYLSPPLVTVSSSGGGYDVTAIAEISNGAISRLVITSPGQSHQAGDALLFTFSGGGPTAPAPELTRVVTASDLAPNSSGGLTKIGEGRLTVNAALSYSGETKILEGGLESNGSIDNSRVTVAPGAIFSGNFISPSAVMVQGTLAPGSGIGAAQTGELTLAAGAALAIDLGDWTQGAGLGFDSISAASLIIQATASGKLRLALDSTLLTNFTETARSLPIVTASSAVSGLESGNWQVEAPGFPGTGTWTLSVSGGKQLMLNYTPGGSGGGGYSAWAAGFPGLSDASSAGDPDRDGVSNLLEYALAGNPTLAGAAILPTASLSGAGFEFTFHRLHTSMADTAQVFEYGSSLSGWTTLALPAASAGNVVITANTPSAGVDLVKITLPASAAVNGRIFGRLRVTRNN